MEEGRRRKDPNAIANIAEELGGTAAFEIRDQRFSCASAHHIGINGELGMRRITISFLLFDGVRAAPKTPSRSDLRSPSQGYVRFPI
jgi:hypothetical protein